MSELYDVFRATLRQRARGGPRSHDKFYQLVLIGTPKNTGLLIRRWGIVTRFGEVSVERLVGIRKAEEVFWNTYKSKVGVASDKYEPKNQEEVSVTFDELPKKIGRMLWSRLDAEDLRFLDPTADTIGVRERDPIRFDEYGNFLGNPEPRKADLTAEFEATKKAKLEELRRLNPNFGLF